MYTTANPLKVCSDRPARNHPLPLVRFHLFHRVPQVIKILALASTLPGILALTALAERPSFIVVLADDLGYGDLGCYGREKAHTPNLDRFAAEGLRLTHCYADSGAANVL